MRTWHIAGADVPLARTPSARRRATHRRAAVAASVLALAGLSAAFGALATRDAADDPADGAAYSYFPTQ